MDSYCYHNVLFPGNYLFGSLMTSLPASRNAPVPYTSQLSAEKFFLRIAAYGLNPSYYWNVYETSIIPIVTYSIFVNPAKLKYCSVIFNSSTVSRVSMVFRWAVLNPFPPSLLYTHVGVGHKHARNFTLR